MQHAPTSMRISAYPAPAGNRFCEHATRPAALRRIHSQQRDLTFVFSARATLRIAGNRHSTPRLRKQRTVHSLAQYRNSMSPCRRTSCFATTTVPQPDRCPTMPPAVRPAGAFFAERSLREESVDSGQRSSSRASAAASLQRRHQQIDDLTNPWWLAAHGFARPRHCVPKARGWVARLPGRHGNRRDNPFLPARDLTDRCFRPFPAVLR